VTLRFRLLFPAILLALALLPPASAQIAQLTPFSADMQVNSKTSHQISGKVYVSRDHMRFDMSSDQGGAIMITNFATKTADMLMPKQQMYMEFKADDTGKRAAMAPSIKAYRDPSNPCAYDEGATCKNLGTEQVHGRSCDHWQITDKSGKVVNVWIDKQLHFPIKSVTEDSTMELTNIQVGEPAANLFTIPPGYHKMDMSGMMQGHSQ